MQHNQCTTCAAILLPWQGQPGLCRAVCHGAAQLEEAPGCVQWSSWTVGLCAVKQLDSGTVCSGAAGQCGCV